MKLKLGKAVKLDFSLRLEDYFYEYRGSAIDNYYYTNIPTVNFIQTKEDRNPMLGFRIALSYKHRIFKNLFWSSSLCASMLEFSDIPIAGVWAKSSLFW